jgi:predicted ABC-class ATPase
MQNLAGLRQKVSALNGKDYGAYQSLLGEYDFNTFKLIIQQIPKDPFAPPHTGIYRVLIPRASEPYINLDFQTKTQQVAFADFLARRFFNAAEPISKGIRGTGFSGVITINQPGQAILERNSVVITDDIIEIRCFLGLPGQGRKIDAATAEKMLLSELPEIINAAYLKQNIDADALNNHLAMAEDAEFLRNQLTGLDLVAFIADGSILPRKSGTSDNPLPIGETVGFKSPDSLRVDIELPHSGKIQGLGIPRGVTLIVGGGYHGKSTLLNALEAGIYNHIPGDGREKCVSLPMTTKIRAYSGRYIEKTDISPFIKNLPFQKDTTAFSTENASGSTSQAANIIEAIEVGTEVLLMDEDTCATNFMIRDSKMQQLVNKDDEPITAFIDRVKQLYDQNQISTILVLGGVGDYFDVSNQVIQLKNYVPLDVTEEAHHISNQAATQREMEDPVGAFRVRDRIPIPETIDPQNQYRKFSVFAKEVHRLNFGRQILDLTDLEQLSELSQTKALGYALLYAKKYMDKKTTLREVVQRVVEDVEEHGLDILSDRISGHFAGFRGLELAFALNRLRGFEVIQKGD